MNPLAILIGVGALAGLAMAMGEKKGGASPKPTPTPTPTPGPKPTPNPIPTPAGNVDIATLLTGALNAMTAAGGQLTPEQLQKLKDVLSNLGTNDQGVLTSRPPVWARDEALAFCDELDKAGVLFIGPAVRTMVLTADKLPETRTSLSGPWEHGPWQKVQGPWHYLGSLTTQNRRAEQFLRPGSYTDISGFGDWWDTFVDKWARNWWRRGSK